MSESISISFQILIFRININRKTYIRRPVQTFENVTLHLKNRDNISMYNGFCSSLICAKKMAAALPRESMSTSTLQKRGRRWLHDRFPHKWPEPRVIWFYEDWSPCAARKHEIARPVPSQKYFLMDVRFWPGPADLASLAPNFFPQPIVEVLLNSRRRVSDRPSWILISKAPARKLKHIGYFFTLGM